MSSFRLTHDHSVLYGLSYALVLYKGQPKKRTSDFECTSKNTIKNKRKKFFERD